MQFFPGLSGGVLERANLFDEDLMGQANRRLLAFQ
jgi:hypothetical protein